MSELKVGDLVKTKKNNTYYVKLCQRREPHHPDKCPTCGFFLCKTARVVEIRSRHDDCVLEANFRPNCNSICEKISDNVWRIYWQLDALEKAFDWVRIK